MNSDVQYNASQSLFQSTQSLFGDLDPILTQDYTQDHHIQKNKAKRFDEVFSERFIKRTNNQLNKNCHNNGSSNIGATVLPRSNDLDIDNILNSQLSGTWSFPTASKPRKSNCFHVPFLQHQPSNKRPTQHNKNQSSLSAETVNKVENFINQYSGTSGKNKHSFVDAQIPILPLQSKGSPIQQPKIQNGVASVIPETPYLDKFTSGKSSDDEFIDNNLILDSDDETKGAIYGPTLQTPRRLTLPPVQTPGGTTKNGLQLRSVEEILLLTPATKYRSVFDAIPYFNAVQSKVLEDALYSDKPLVVCAPTGSGKTIIFELAITRLLIKNDEFTSTVKNRKKKTPKIVYMAPIKALCSERHEDWSRKFQSVGLECQELTGDSDVDDYWQLQKADIILTTPEKWDSMTRRWRDNSSLVRQVQLFLIDEVHLLNDEARGATMEAVVSRMKTIQGTFNDSNKGSELRFVAVSATIPNTDDIAEWLGSSKQPAVTFDMDDSYRPVELRKVVLGYPYTNGSEFKFDISLNYKLFNVIQTYSDNKPTLVFCSTRKSVEQAASTLIKDSSFIIDASHQQTLIGCANLVRNHRLRDMLQKGVGYHHAGLDAHDRHLVEDIFTKGDLLVLVCTSTLAMGVNLPAHLVVVKSTSHYVKGMFQEYTQSEILQMIGRAGRPQFDTTATAVIMTRSQSRDLYRNVVNGSQKIESSLHRHLIEHLNAEIVLATIHDVTIALEWIRSTFLYIRLLKNPTHYGYPHGLSKTEAEKRLHELCMHNLDLLTSIDLVSIDNDLRLLSSEPGKLMARYSIAFETMKKFSTLSGKESLEELIGILSGCHEFQDITLRMNERTSLNKMNKDKNRVTIRYPIPGRIKTTQMKVSCLMQATLGCINVQDFTLSQDVNKIFRNAMRVSRCLVEVLFLKDNFKSLYNSTLLSKCIKAKLWENSRYVTKQLPNIGPTLSTALANAGVCSFAKLEATDPREIELIVNRHAPFGNHLREAVKRLPKYTVHVEQSKRYCTDICDITVQVFLSNAEDLKDLRSAEKRHGCYLLIGNADNCVVLKQKLSDIQLLSIDGSRWQRTLSVRRASKGDELSVNLLSQEYVGLDVESTYTPYYLGPRRMIATTTGVQNNASAGAKESKYFDKKKKPCRHTCHNKRTCAHECCKIMGNSAPTSSRSTEASTSDIKKNNGRTTVDYLHQYDYNPQLKYKQQTNQVVPCTPTYQRSKGWEHLDSFCDYQQIEESNTELQPKMTQFEKEQMYYDDQINLGSRIKCRAGANEDNDNRRTANKQGIGDSKQLWSEKCFDSQNEVIIDLNKSELPPIQPRPPKYGFKKQVKTSSASDMCKQSQMKNDHSAEAPKRMGKVFAWKSTTGSKNNAFPPSLSEKCPRSETNLPDEWSSAPAQSQEFDPFRNNRSSNVGATSYRGNTTISRPNTFPMQKEQFNSADTLHPVKDKNSHYKCRSAPMKGVEQTSKICTQDYGNQLWDQAPSYSDDAKNNMLKKRVTFGEHKPKPIEMMEYCDNDDEQDVSINCDFTLEDDDEDLLMMQACLQAEEDQPEDEGLGEITEGNMCFPSQSIPPITTSFSSSNFSSTQEQSSQYPLDSQVSLQSQRRPVKRKLDSFFSSSSADFSQVPTKKATDIADARKMFDSIFDGLF